MESTFKLFKERFTKRLSVTPFITAASSNHIEKMDRIPVSMATRKYSLNPEFYVLTSELYTTVVQEIPSSESRKCIKI